MQTEQTNARTAGDLNHPAEAQWMAFLYGEVSPERKRELGAHLAQCAACSARVKAWRSTSYALDDWSLQETDARARSGIEARGLMGVLSRLGLSSLGKEPLPSRFERPTFAPQLKWAIAVLLLGLGVVLGAQTWSAKRELSTLKTALAQIADAVENRPSSELDQAAEAAADSAASETLTLLSDYARLQEAQRATDRQAFKLALEELEARVAQLRTELETVAVNTQDGFQQTHQNLSRLVSYAVPLSSPQRLNTPPNVNP